MNIKEAFIPIKESNKIFYIIEKELLINPNTQIFIENQIYNELMTYGHGKYHVFKDNYTKSNHYNVDQDNFGGEQWLSLSKGLYYGENIARGSFIDNSSNYMQLVEFDSEKIKKYVHFKTTFDRLLLIKAIKKNL